jgi:hypothetical protein
MTTPPSRNSFGQVESHTSEALKYRITHPAKRNGLFIIDSIIKVESGVRFLCETWPSRPPETLIVHRCAQHGEFSKRPFVCSQPTDDSTVKCVLALYYDYCRRSKLDAAQLMATAYPGGESVEDWSPLRWRRILESAQWHGTSFPKPWSTGETLGLLLALKGQKLLHLAKTLAYALNLRHVDRILLLEEPS